MRSSSCDRRYASPLRSKKRIYCVVELLLKFGAIASEQNIKDQTPLDLAKSQGHEYIAQLLEIYSKEDETRTLNAAALASLKDPKFIEQLEKDVFEKILPEKARNEARQLISQGLFGATLAIKNYNAVKTN